MRVKGTAREAIIYTNNAQEAAIAKIDELMHQPFISGTKMNWQYVDQFDSIHNYIDTDSMILRKGAVRAARGEKLVIPMNMRDDSFICVGKGNSDWNESALHGAGRLFSRSAALKNLSMDDFKATMKDVWSTSVKEQTLDEASMTYKPMKEIEEQIGETVTILKRIIPVYNFKASEQTMPKWRQGKWKK